MVWYASLYSYLDEPLYVGILELRLLPFYVKPYTKPRLSLMVVANHRDVSTSLISNEYTFLFFLLSTNSLLLYYSYFVGKLVPSLG
jgi:hypothetical protein